MRLLHNFPRDRRTAEDEDVDMQIEGQQVERNQSQQEKAALAKLDRIKLDQGKRADDLERDAAEAESKVPEPQHQLSLSWHVKAQSVLNAAQVHCQSNTR